MKKMVKTFIKNKVPVILYGPPGVGKNYLLSEIAAEEGMEYVVVEAASLTPEDVNGLPVAEGRNTLYTTSWILDLCKKDRPVLLVFDEVFSAKPDVLASLHGIFHPEERRVGSAKLPNNVYVAGTTNISGDHVLGSDPALINRVAFIPLRQLYIPENLEIITQFLKANPSLVLKETNEDFKQFPSLRTWYLLFKIIVLEKPPAEEIKFYAEALVGEEAAKLFMDFYKKVYGKLSTKDYLTKNVVAYFLIESTKKDPVEVIKEIYNKNVDGFAVLVSFLSKDEKYKYLLNEKDISTCIKEVSKRISKLLES